MQSLAKLELFELSGAVQKPTPTETNRHGRNTKESMNIEKKVHTNT